jgi:TPR repeat protein
MMEDTRAAIEAEQWLQKGRGFFDEAPVGKLDPVKAVACFEQGLRVMPKHKELRSYLGMMYQDGEGVPEDYAKAIEHYTVAAEQGDPSAQRSLGEIYDDADELHEDLQDYSKAFTWYRRAAEQGDTHSQGRLGFFYRSGLGTETDSKQAFLWYLKAAIAGDVDAQAAVGDMYAKGEGIEADVLQAKDWTSKADTQKLQSDLSLIHGFISRDELAMANGGLYAVLEKHPFCTEALRLQSLVRATVGDFPEALAAAVILTTIEPHEAKHWKLRGELELELSFRYSAIRSLTEQGNGER